MKSTPGSALARLAGRCSGGVVSLLLHGTLMLLAFLSVAAPRTGRGGGVVGSSNPGDESREYSATVRREDTVETSKSADARLFPQAEPEPETPDVVPPTTEDFLLEPTEAAIPVARPPQDPETAPPTRAKDAYAKLPPAPPPYEPAGDGGAQKGNSPVNGAGGDLDGAGDGRVGGIFMPAPEYPFSARRKGIEGQVVIEIDVTPDGHVDEARIAVASGCDALDEAALSAIRKWKYEPQPGDSKATRRVRFIFKLNK